MFTYKEYDDFFSGSVQEDIESYLLTRMFWKYVSNVSGHHAGSSAVPLPIAEDQGGFTGYVFSPDLKWPTNHELMNKMNPIMDSLKDIFPFDIKVTRIRAGLFQRSPFSGIHVPHVDFHYPHYTMLLYINESDGDTVLFNEKVDVTREDWSYPQDFSVMGRVAPQSGKAVLFNGLHYHSSSTVTKHATRLAININFVQDS